MTIKKLKELIADLPDDMRVLVPAEPKEGFTGVWFSPCEEDSSVITMHGDENTTEDEVEAFENKAIDLESEDAFALIPCGFLEDHDNNHLLN